MGKIIVNTENAEKEAKNITDAAEYFYQTGLSPQYFTSTIRANKKSINAFNNAEEIISQFGNILEKDGQIIKSMSDCYAGIDSMVARLYETGMRYEYFSEGE